MFKLLDSKKEFELEVAVKTDVDAEPGNFKITCLLLDDKTFNDACVSDADQSADEKIIRACVVGWSDLYFDTGETMSFNDTNMSRICRTSYLRAAMAKKIIDWHNSFIEMNLGKS